MGKPGRNNVPVRTPDQTQLSESPPSTEQQNPEWPEDEFCNQAERSFFGLIVVWNRFHFGLIAAWKRLYRRSP